MIQYNKLRKYKIAKGLLKGREGGGEGDSCPPARFQETKCPHPACQKGNKKRRKNVGKGIKMKEKRRKEEKMGKS